MDTNVTAQLLGSLGAVVAMALSTAGSAFATGKQAKWIGEMDARKKSLRNETSLSQDNDVQITDETNSLKSMVGVIFAGMPAIYGLIMAVMILSGTHPDTSYTLSKAVEALASGLMVGSCSAASGYTMGQIQPHGHKFIVTCLLNIFAEAIALYGLIVALIII